MCSLLMHVEGLLRPSSYSQRNGPEEMANNPVTFWMASGEKPVHTAPYRTGTIRPELKVLVRSGPSSYSRFVRSVPV